MPNWEHLFLPVLLLNIGSCKLLPYEVFDQLHLFSLALQLNIESEQNGVVVSTWSLVPSRAHRSNSIETHRSTSTVIVRNAKQRVRVEVDLVLKAHNTTIVQHSVFGLPITDRGGALLLHLA
jgi:hypothetical protein